MSVALNAKKREDHAKSTTKQLRKNGQVPAVVYGKEKESKSIAVNSMELLKTVRDEGKNAIISLQIEGESPVNVMLHEYQTDNIKDLLVHADFYMVNMTEEMDASVPVRIVGEPENGVVQQPLYEVQVRAVPTDIPTEISIDISSHSIGDIIAVKDLPSAKTYQVTDDPDTVIASVLAPNTNADVECTEETTEQPELTGEAQTEENAD
ncbi:50S ribosomal protein L25/general stress protein Ctc [Ornithinibacillus contaminans]|uniref:50S ribosomal protein L25/general stress protein Ctc n=1 Tax=Ornithinibacillus contaminans TaxID=694055 RepID=UPI00064E0342|nr:50S ribosomal protein L25/general stress protein Ctc [Ornithinibacillus contaminans]